MSLGIPKKISSMTRDYRGKQEWNRVKPGIVVSRATINS